MTYVTSKSVEVSELSEGAFARVVEINFSEFPFAGHFNKSFSLKLRYGIPSPSSRKKPINYLIDWRLGGESLVIIVKSHTCLSSGIQHLYDLVTIVPQGASNGSNKLLLIDTHCYSYRHFLVSIYVDGLRSYPTGIEYQ